ncbi:ribosomal protein S7 domain-containing protein [Dissophora ornata]|nr:hypothetical protein BGZ58_000902 [Dissophora ornata]KAI8603801.1 ribosomal protein S7 domain-containing protein [Dissophora ornata]
MLRNFARLGGVSSVRIWKQQAQIHAHVATAAAGTVASRWSVAQFHSGTRPNAVAASPNAATTPSTPLPPPMTSSSETTAATTLTKSTATATPEVPAATKAASSSSSPSSPSSSSSSEQKPLEAAGEEEDVSGEVKEKEGEETEEEGAGSRQAAAFAEFVPVSPEQARSLNENPILKQLVNTIMKDGKKARAQRFVADAMLEIRSRTHSDPYQVVLDALELASPILKLTPIKKGSKVLQVPNPMTERQRRRKAIVWILEASDKRKGEKAYKDRLATEFLAVVNGNSGALVKKNQLHKMALANRANASLKY